MRDLKLNVMYFSPTKSSETIAKKVASGMGLDYKEYNLTYDRSVDKKQFGENDILIVSIPVHGGRVPELLIDTLKQIKGNDSYFLPIINYGNRAFEDSLIELNDIFTSNGFITVGYGIFISEHSYSNKYAGGRPDEDDLRNSEEFGKKIYDRILKSSDKHNIFVEEIPGSRPYKERAEKIAWGPVASDKCIFCGECISLCPVDAINHLNPKKTDYDKCIHCCACIKGCSENAKRNEGEFFDKIVNLLDAKAIERKEIVLK